MNNPPMKIAIFRGLILDFGRPWGGIGGGQGGHGLVLGVLWVFLAFLGGFWELARGVLETEKGFFFTSMLT